MSVGERAVGSHILAAARHYQGPWLILATAPLLYVWLIVFWDGRRAGTAVWFSIGVVATAAIWAIQGWEPWNMAWLRIPRGRQGRSDDSSVIEQTVSDFFLEPMNMTRQFAWISLGAIWPWVIMGVGKLCDGQFIKTSPTIIPWWGMVILGVGEAVRGRGTALFVLSRELERNWPALLRSAGGKA